MPACIYAVILNYNGFDVLPACVSSIELSRGVNVKILVVDNASTDGSMETLRANFPNVETIQLPENIGFCRGNNAGMEHALKKGADFVWLLNNDVELDPGAARQLLNAAEAFPQGGAFGGKIYHHGSNKIFQSAGSTIDRRYILAMSRGRGEQDNGQFEDPCEVDYMSGCSLFLRSNVLKQTGLLDPRYQFYWEDVDLCLRIKANNFQVRYVPEAVTWHRESYGFGDSFSLRSVYYSSRNRLLTARKHNLGSPSFIRKTTLRLTINEYPTMKSLGATSPSKALVAWMAGIVDYYRGHFGPSPAWLDRLQAKPSAENGKHG